MRKLLFLISFIILVSCANNSPVSNEKSVIEDSFTVKEYSTPVIVKEKFIEFYDLKILLKNKPEFKESIEKRLTDFKFDSITILNLSKDSKIKSIKVTELSINKKNNNVIVKLVFKIVDKEKTKKDSIIGIVLKDEIIMNNEKITSTKIKFSKFFVTKD